MTIAVMESNGELKETLCDVIQDMTDQKAELYSFSNASELIQKATDTCLDVVFLELPLPGEDGIELAKSLQQLRERVNLIFCADSEEYAYQAFLVRASGYLLKPVSERSVLAELQHLRYPVRSFKRVFIQCFGNFEIYVDGKPLCFDRERTKEVLAYLVDRNGVFCTNAEIVANLWEDDLEHVSYLQKIRQDMKSTFEQAGCGEILEFGWGKMRICKEVVTCDYYDWLKNKKDSIYLYRGEYMRNYTWAEYTNGKLMEL